MRYLAILLNLVFVLIGTNSWAACKNQPECVPESWCGASLPKTVGERTTGFDSCGCTCTKIAIAVGECPVSEPCPECEQPEPCPNSEPKPMQQWIKVLLFANGSLYHEYFQADNITGDSTHWIFKKGVIEVGKTFKENTVGWKFFEVLIQ